jgi:hypothetical protein
LVVLIRILERMAESQFFIPLFVKQLSLCKKGNPRHQNLRPASFDSRTDMGDDNSDGVAGWGAHALSASSGR